MMRKLRQWLTARFTDAGMAIAPWVRTWAVDALEDVIARCGPIAPVMGRIVADNMRAVGLYTAQTHRDYFSRVAAHLTSPLHIFRYADRTVGPEPGVMPDGLASIIKNNIKVDESIASLYEAVALNKGAIVAILHPVNYLFGMARLNMEVPMTVHLRYSKEPARRIAKQRWCQATGVGSIADPEKPFDRMVEALEHGRALFVAPDLPQKPPRGKPVRFFDREIRLPSGAAALSVVTGAPLLALTAKPQADAVCLVLHGPYQGDPEQESRAGKDAVIQQRLQWLTDCLERFLREHPALWFLWGDKRWTKVFRGDPRYVRFVNSGVTQTRASAATDVAGDRP